jgi:hypothetical protein
MIAIFLLEIFLDNRNESGGLTREQLLVLLRRKIEKGDVHESYGIYLRYYRFELAKKRINSEFNLIDFLTDYLRGLGLITDWIDKESGQRHWSIADSWPPPRPPNDGGGGNIGGGTGGGGNDNGGGGLREVLGHPVLFALARDDFNSLIDNIFE